MQNSSSPAKTTLTFKDPRLFRIITLVCRETDNTLWPAQVSLNGGTAINSLSPLQLPSGVSA